MVINSISKILCMSRDIDLFKSPSEKRYELTIICQHECSEFQDPLTLGLRCARIEILSLKATSHSTIFDIPMRPVREDQDTDDVLPLNLL